MKPPFNIKGLDHVVLRVQDVEHSLIFYRDVLGCPIDKIQADLGLYQVRAGNSLIDLVDMDGKLGQMGGKPPGTEGRNMDHFAIQVEPFDLQIMKDYLDHHNVPIGEDGLRYGAEGDGPSLYVTDPDGNVVELKGPAT